MSTILRSTCRDLDAVAVPHPVVYTSEAACQTYCERLQRHMLDPNAKVLGKIAPLNLKLLSTYDQRGKASVDYVDQYYAASLKALRTIAGDEAIVATRTLRKIQRQIRVEIQTEVLIKRGTLALCIRGMMLRQDRHSYVKTLYHPQVRLTVHAMARFMYRAKAPPQEMIHRLGRLASWARLLSDTDPVEGSVALAIPEGLVHGRIGQLGESEGFATRCSVGQGSDLERLFVERKPTCAHASASAIDLITFLPLADLNPHLSALHAALTALQDRCTRAAEIAYAMAFHDHAPNPEDMACLDEAGRAIRAHLASDLHRTYRMKQDDREITALVQQLNRESETVTGETAMMAAMATARAEAAKLQGDRSLSHDGPWLPSSTHPAEAVHDLRLAS